MFQVAPDQAGQRLDVFLAQQAPDITRSAAARLIREGNVRVAGRVVKPGLPLKAGDQLEMEIPPPVPTRLEAQALPLQVVYEDTDLAVVNKPAGMVTHPAPGHPDRTLVNALLHHLTGLSGIGGEERPGIVHRLDKDTSGLMLVAKNDRAHRALSAAIQARTVQRWYKTVVWGKLTVVPRLVENQLGRDPKNRQLYTVVAQGRLSSTRIESQEIIGSGFSLWEVKLNTGRTHQIRVHSRHLGCPVVGDRVYGKSAEARLLSGLKLPRPERQLLHSTRLVFQHPITGAQLEFNAPLPEDMTVFIQACRTRNRT
ncbi:MAG: RluA family pseudouridine synthase [Candidatus Firestonebacteria bacterium]|nr:RluA family pseudouridine synthase [Candidatus Firestonebacteria bacterium]